MNQFEVIYVSHLIGTSLYSTSVTYLLSANNLLWSAYLGKFFFFFFSYLPENNNNRCDYGVKLFSRCRRRKKSHHPHFLKHGDSVIVVKWKKQFCDSSALWIHSQIFPINPGPASFTRAWAYSQKCPFTLSSISCAVFLMVLASWWSNSEAKERPFAKFPHLTSIFC